MESSLRVSNLLQDIHNALYNIIYTALHCDTSSFSKNPDYAMAFPAHLFSLAHHVGLLDYSDD